MSTRPVMCMSTYVSTCRYPVKLRITTGSMFNAFNCKLSNICLHMNNSFWIHGRTTFQVTWRDKGWQSSQATLNLTGCFNVVWRCDHFHFLTESSVCHHLITSERGWFFYEKNRRPHRRRLGTFRKKCISHAKSYLKIVSKGIICGIWLMHTSLWSRDQSPQRFAPYRNSSYENLYLITSGIPNI